jgi:cell division protein FtsQ
LRIPVRPVLTGVLVLVTGIAVASLVDWARDPRTLPLRTVGIEGELHFLGAEQLQNALTPAVAGGFFGVDVNAVRCAAETMPWVQRASVQKVWPDTLVVSIEEQSPVAHWGEGALLNRYGETFAPAQIPPLTALPVLHGPDGHEQLMLEQYDAMSKVLAPLELKVAKLVEDERRSWHVELDDGTRLELGRTEPLFRLRRFVRAYPALFASRAAELRSVDLRYSNGMAVQWDASEPVAGTDARKG